MNSDVFSVTELHAETISLPEYLSGRLLSGFLWVFGKKVNLWYTHISRKCILFYIDIITLQKTIDSEIFRILLQFLLVYVMYSPPWNGHYFILLQHFVWILSICMPTCQFQAFILYICIKLTDSVVRSQSYLCRMIYSALLKDTQEKKLIF